MKFLVVEPSPHPILIHFGPKYSPQLLFSNTLRLHSSINVRDHVSQPYSTTGNIILREESRLRVFEKRVLRRIFGPTRDVNGVWRRLHNEELHSLYRSPNIARVIKSRRLRWAEHVARMEECFQNFNINLQERDLWGGLGVDGRTLEWTLKR